MANEFIARKGLIALDDIQITGSLGVSSILSIPGFTNVSASLAAASGGSGDGFPFTGSAGISGSLELIGSGSTLFNIIGSEGTLFSITDSLSGSLFAVSDVSGLPILEVFSDDTVKIGSFNDEAITVSGSHTTIGGVLAIPGFTNVSASLAAATAGGGTITGVTAGTGLTGGGSAGTVTLNVVGGTGITANANDIEVDATIATVVQLNASSSALQSNIDGKQDTLTFGKSSGNALKSEEALTTNNVLLMGASNVKGRTYSELKTDLSLNNVENTALSTYTGNGGALDNQYITNGAGYATGDNFDSDGTFASLRAQGTTKADVGLPNVTNESKTTMFTSPTFTGNSTFTNITASGNISSSGTITAEDIVVADDFNIGLGGIINVGDKGEIKSSQGNDNFYIEGTDGSSIDINDSESDVDVKIRGANGNYYFKTDAGAEKVGIGGDFSTTVPGETLTVHGNISASGTFISNGVTVDATGFGAADNALQVVNSSGTSIFEVEGTGDVTANQSGRVAAFNIVRVAAGAQSAPSIAFTSDANTGIYSPSSDQINIQAGGGTTELFVNTSGVTVNNGTFAIPGFSDVSASLAAATAGGGTITGVTAGTGLTGGGGAGSVTLNVVGGTGITANANDIAVDATIATVIQLNASSSALQTNIDGKQATLTFGKSSGNALKSEEALTTNDILLAGSTNIKGRTYAELKSDLSLNNVENTALSTYTGNGGALDNQYITNGAGYTTNTGTVDTTGTVNANEFARFDDSNTLEALTVAETKTALSLNNVENTAISTFAGSSNITTVGTLGSLTTTGDIGGNGSILKVSEIDTSAGSAGSAGDKGVNAETVTFYSTTNNIVAGGVYYLGSSAWTYANADDVSTTKGFMGVATSGNSNTGMVIRGIVYVETDPGGSVGDVVYLSKTNGRLTTDISSFGAGDVARIMGYKVGTGLVFFDTSKDYIELDS